MSSPLSAAITDLSSGDAIMRAAAATEIYRRGPDAADLCANAGWGRQHQSEFLSRALAKRWQGVGGIVRTSRRRLGRSGGCFWLLAYRFRRPRQLGKGPQHLAHGPSLRNAAPRRERRAALENLRQSVDGANAHCAPDLVEKSDRPRTIAMNPANPHHKRSQV